MTQYAKPTPRDVRTLTDKFVEIFERSPRHFIHLNALADMVLEQLSEGEDRRRKAEGGYAAGSGS